MTSEDTAIRTRFCGEKGIKAQFQEKWSSVRFLSILSGAGRGTKPPQSRVPGHGGCVTPAHTPSPRRSLARLPDPGHSAHSDTWPVSSLWVFRCEVQ